MKTIRYELTEGIATLTFDEPGSPVNTMGQPWQQDMTQVVAQVLADRAQIRGIVLASAKSSFFAGADLKGVLQLHANDAPRVFAEIEQIKKNFRALETLGLPVVSCLNGSALGGGWEVALIGHHRIAVDQPKIQFGLPEVTLGLLPGASGVTKMTRHLGLLGAQPYLIEGKLFGAREALEMGLVHELVNDTPELRAAALAWIAAHPAAQHPWEAADYKIPGGTPANPKIASLLSVAPAMLRKKTRGLYPAPEAILACMVEGAQVDMPTALRIESRYLARLMTGVNARAMIGTFFFDLNAVKTAFAKSEPARAGARLDWSSFPAAERLQRSYARQGAAMQGEGIPAAVINNAALQCGMQRGPVAPDSAKAANRTPAPEWNLRELKDRLLYCQAIAAARCLQEGVIADVAHANVGSIFGAGFPGWTGGALQFIGSVGVDAFTRRAAELAARYGEEFELDDKLKHTLERVQPLN